MGSFSSDKQVSFESIKKEFQETFGYISGDIKDLLDRNTRLHYTIALLVCCACEMLTWHRKEALAHVIFTSLLPNTERYPKLGEILWDTLRNGLAHHFRPKTIAARGEEWRITISSEPSGMHLSVTTEGKLHWIHINVRKLAEQVVAKISDYERELQSNAKARITFAQRAKDKYNKVLNENAIDGFNALTSLPDATPF